MGWFSSNKSRAFTEKLMKDIRAREDRENVETIGKVSPEIKEKRNVENTQASNSKKMEQTRKEREEKDKAEDGLKLVIDTAKIECTMCTNPKGILKVNFDTPTIQSKKTATVKEKDAKSLIFMGTCTKSPNSASPCAAVMQLGNWKDVGSLKVQEQFPLLLKSTIKCNYGGVDIKITDCGQINEPSNINVLGAPLPPPRVTIGKIIRGNPYVPKNATDIDLPPSIPLNKTYEIEIKVTGKGTVDLALINSNANNGNATITPSKITKTTKVVVKGTAMTLPSHGGQLKVEAKVNGIVVATSQGFTVCCHPIDYTDTYFSDVNGSAIGFVVQDGWNSDSGNFADLLNVKISELVKEVKSDSPPFIAMGTSTVQNSGYLPGNQLTKDTHTIGPRPALGPIGTQEFHQLCIYKCNCCGANDIVMPNSGFKIIHEVFKTGTLWKHIIKKIGAGVTVNGYTTQAGTANALSPIHNLP